MDSSLRIGQSDNKRTMVQVIAWIWIDDKLLLELMVKNII